MSCDYFTGIIAMAFVVHPDGSADLAERGEPTGEMHIRFGIDTQHISVCMKNRLCTGGDNAINHTEAGDVGVVVIANFYLRCRDRALPAVFGTDHLHIAANFDRAA